MTYKPWLDAPKATPTDYQYIPPSPPENAPFANGATVNNVTVRAPRNANYANVYRIRTVVSPSGDGVDLATAPTESVAGCPAGAANYSFSVQLNLPNGTATPADVILHFEEFVAGVWQSKRQRTLRVG